MTMKRTCLISCLALGMSLGLMAQPDDPVVMTVGSEKVTRSEFEYNFNKNNTDAVVDRKSVREYADMYAVYRMKVLAALDARLDTVTSYQKEFRHYRDLQIRPLLVSDAVVEQECTNYYNRMLESLGGKDLIKPAHIFLMLGQNAPKEQIEETKVRIDSIYKALAEGADFETLAKELSQDRQTAVKGGVLPWVGPGQTLKEFEDVAYALKVGEMSKPVQSPVGYHIIKMMERKELEPFDSLHTKIHAYLERRGIRDQLAGTVVDSLRAKYNGEKTAEEILDMETERLCAQDMELKYLVKEYHDGLLLYDLCSQQIWEPAKADTVGIENHFKSNRKSYAWDKPHYSGMVYYCKNEADVAAVKKLLKKVPEDKWITTVREAYNKDSVCVRMEKRLFAEGDNDNVDALALKVKGKDIKPVNGFPYVGVVGKVLKKGPAKWTDVSAQVVQDYQKAKEDEYVETLRRKYPVVINEAVLSTVNQGGNN